MSDRIKQLRDDYQRAAEEAERARFLCERLKHELQRAENECQHLWGEPRYAGRRIEGYTIPGDTPGTMGVDFRGPVDVGPRQIDAWERVCQKCGKVENTNRTKTVETKVPEF